MFIHICQDENQNISITEESKEINNVQRSHFNIQSGNIKYLEFRVLRCSLGQLPLFFYSNELKEAVAKEITEQNPKLNSNDSLNGALTFYDLQSYYLNIIYDEINFTYDKEFLSDRLDIAHLLSSKQIKSILQGDYEQAMGFLAIEGLAYQQLTLSDKKNTSEELEEEYLNFTTSDFSMELYEENQAALQKIYNELLPYEKSVAYVFRDYAQSFLIGVLLAKKLINAVQALEWLNSMINVANSFEYISRTGDTKAFHEELVTKCNIFLNIKRKEELEEVISKGESKFIEFKSTLRYDLRVKQNLKDREKDVLRTIVGFLNSDGGTLFIGVSDESDILGLEPDGFPNIDKFLLHLNNLIQDKISPRPTRLLDTEIFEIQNKEICKVTCRVSNKPVFLKWKNNEEFYVRTGPSTRALSGRDLLNYVQDKFE